MQYWTTKFLRRPEAIDEEANEPFRIEEIKDCTEGPLEHPRPGVSACTSRKLVIRIETGHLSAEMKVFARLKKQMVLTTIVKERQTTFRSRFDLEYKKMEYCTLIPSKMNYASFLCPRSSAAYHEFQSSSTLITIPR